VLFVAVPVATLVEDTRRVVVLVIVCVDVLVTVTLKVDVARIVADTMIAATIIAAAIRVQVRGCWLFMLRRSFVATRRI
jgi:hypothetical protein